MAINKVIFGGNTLIDLTGDTITSDKMLAGTTAHDKSGEAIIGLCTYDSDTQDATAAAAEILKNKTAYVRGAKVTGSMPNNGAQVGNITNANDSVVIKQGYHDGSGYVQIAESEQEKIIPENIRAGITLLGVDGSMTGTEDANPEAITVVPTVDGQTILPNTDKGYNYISQVTVAPIPYTETENSAGGTTVTIAS